MTKVTKLFGKNGPDWRWQTSLAPASAEILRRRINDATLSRATHYVDVWRSQGLDEAQRAEPEIAAAITLNADRAAVRAMKLLVLGDCCADAIALRINCDVRLVKCWEELFYAVRPAREHLRWIIQHVITPEADHGDPHFARLMRLATTSGPEAAELLVDLDTASPTSAEWPLSEADRLLARRLKWELHFDAASELIPTTTKQALVFMKAHVELMHRRAQLELASQKLEERVREAARQHKIKTLRLEANIARENRKAAEAAERHAARAARAEERAEIQRKIRLEDVLPAIPRLHRPAHRTA